jgi:hypothetical protein
LKILLVNPAFDRKAEAPPLGLLCLAAVLMGDGHETRVIDFDVPGSGEPHEDKIKRSTSSDPLYWE